MKHESIPLTTLTTDGKLYFNPLLGTTEALIPSPVHSTHAADLQELPNGDLLAVWFAGTKEGDSNISIALSRLNAGSNQWTEPTWVTDDPLRSEQNPSLWLTPAGELWLIYTAQLGRENKMADQKNLQCTAEIRVKKSTDGGYTWSSHEVMFSRPGSFCRQKPQVLLSGRWIFDNWICFNDDTHYGSDITIMQVSDDEGKTWRGVEVPESRGCVHANIIETDPGQLVALFRSRSADNIYISHSYDNGDSWEPPYKTELPNNNASISAIKLQSGNLAVIYNHYTTGGDRSQTVWPYERCPVSIALSCDKGNTWPYRRHLETGEGFFGEANTRSNRKYEYPVIMQGSDGQIHAAYSFGSRLCIKYAALDEQWIMGTIPEERD